MAKTHSIGGFGAHFQSERDPKEDELDRELEDDKPGIEEELVAMIAERYAPVETLAESTEQKSTLDLIDEIESFTDVSKSKLVLALKAWGFNPYYTGNQFVWLLKER